MKLRNKICIIGILLLFCVMLQNSLFAVDRVYMAVRKDVNGELQIWYRTIVQPASGYLGHFDSFNTWKYEMPPNTPTQDSYATKYLIFTKEKIGNYVPNSKYTDANGNIPIGYFKFNTMKQEPEIFLSSDASAVKEWVENLESDKNSYVKYVEVTDNESVFGSNPMYKYQYKGNDASSKKIRSKISNVLLTEAAFKKYNENSILSSKNQTGLVNGITSKKEPFARLISNTTAYSKATKKYYTAFVTNTPAVEGLVTWDVAREMLYSAVYSGKPNKEKHNTTNIYDIMDVRIDANSTQGLFAWHNEAENKDKTIYVSSIVDVLQRGTTQNQNIRITMITPGAFVFALGWGIWGDTSGYWGANTMGMTNNGLSSGLNLWDNELVLPVAETKSKKIVVNHIAVSGEGDSKTFRLIETTEETLNAKNENDTSYVPIDTLYHDTTNNTVTTQTSILNDSKRINLKKVLSSKSTIKNTEGDDMTLYTIKALATSTKYQVTKLKNNKYYTYEGYVIDRGTKVNAVLSGYFADKYKTKHTPGDAVFTLGNDDNEIIVNLYYKEEAKTVTVVHKACTNKTGCEEIEGNKELTVVKGANNTTTLTYTGESKIETYKVGRTYDVSATRSSKTAFEYKGYIVGNGTMLNTSYTAMVKADSTNYGDIKITFYYQAVENREYGPPPEIDITGTLSVVSSTGTAGTCLDEEIYSLPTNVKDNTQDIYVGIKNTPTYILAGIDVGKKDNGGTVTINVNLKFGPNSKNWKLEVPYNISYYVINNLLIYKYNSATIYDAGQTNTTGDSVFAQNSFKITPKNTSSLSKIGGYLRTYVKLGYVYEDLTPEGIEELKARDLEYFLAFSSQVTETLKYEEITNSISEYIKVTYKYISGEKEYAIDVSELKEKYKEIELNAEVSVDIELLDKETFEKVDGNGNETIEESDLKKFEDDTDAKKAEYTKAVKAYAVLCERVGTKVCIDNANKRFDDKKTEYETAKDYSTTITELEELDKNYNNSKVEKEKAETTQKEASSAYAQTVKALETAEKTYAEIKESYETPCYENCQDSLYNLNLAYKQTDGANANQMLAKCQELDDRITKVTYEDGAKTCVDWLVGLKEADVVNAGSDKKTSERNLTKANEDLEVAKSKYNVAEKAYKEKCESFGLNIGCKDTLSVSLNSVIESAKKAYIEECQKYNSLIEDVDGCSDIANSKVENNGKIEYTKINTKINELYTNYRNALTDLKTAYNAEVFAYQNYDEVKYIQDNLFAPYNPEDDKSKADIADMLGLNVKFSYSSENAKLGNTYLMTLDKDEYIIDISAANYDFAEAPSIVASASRPYLDDNQESYYTSGIPESLIGNEAGAKGYYDSNGLQTIPITKLNGIRVLAATANYSISDNLSITSGTTGYIIDDMYHYDKETGDEKIFNVSKDATFTKTYGVKENAIVANKQEENSKYNSGLPSSETFNIFSPLEVKAEIQPGNGVVNQMSSGTNANVSVIQANAPFVVKFTNPKDNVPYGKEKSDFTVRYKQATYIKFEFDVTDVKYANASGVENSYGSFLANEWIGPIYGDTLTATPNLGGRVDASTTYDYDVIAVAVNARESWTKQLLASIAHSLDDLKDQDLINLLKNICGYEGKDKLSYYADNSSENKPKITIINRVFDFRVTDLKDIDWKNVFRTTSTSSSVVNEHSGIAYYSGLNKWNVYSTKQGNEIIGRTADEIGDTATRILPLGPYKNTDTTYISAPKMGYRFSFDLKVTGTINDGDNKHVEIVPSFYYISKDGKTFYSEKTGTVTSGIYLFYKNSSGQYVRVGSTNDTYQIQFTPNDGYRSIISAESIYLSYKTVTLGTLKELKLEPDKTTTRSLSDEIVTYYGEYKLPNSTIAVRVDQNGNYDINKPLTDGYIGVIFNIKAYETNDSYLEYSKGSESNTSQWDYEGYLGIEKPGESYSTTLKLEKGTWKIDENMYKKIKGTVILYDLDNKASSDFN